VTETTLDGLDAGDQATVVGYTGAPPARLLEMGLVPGTPVVFVRRAPLGDPLDLRVRGFHLSVRADEAARVVVRRG
jgi:Fe2+ transport system protein FeoA